MTKEECSKRVAELIELTKDMIVRDIHTVWEDEEYKKASNELDQLLDYRKDMWPDDYDERAWARVTDEKAHRYGETGLVGYVSHNDVGVTFIDGEVHYYHAMSLEKVKSSPEIRAVWGEIPHSQYFTKKEAKSD